MIIDDILHDNDNDHDEIAAELHDKNNDDNDACQEGGGEKIGAQGGWLRVHLASEVT